MTSRPSAEEEWVEQCEILPPRDIRSGDWLLVFVDHASALGFLRRLSHDTLTMQALWSALAEVDEAALLRRMRDHEILGRLAWRLAARSLRIAVKLGKRPTGGVSGKITSAPAPLPARSPRPSPPEPPRPREATVSPSADPLFDSLDAIAQAETLRQAARDGIPFCEECEKARRAG